MAAGQGFKTFNTGDILTAADTNGYLMQGVWVFANAAARTAAVTSPQEGNVSYLKDTDSLEIYSGSAWVAYGSGDITGVTTGASSGLTGGVTSGTADLKLNTTAKGGLLIGTGSGTVSELAVGTNNYILTADSTQTTGVKWAAAAGGGKVLQVVSATLSTTFTTTSTSSQDIGLSASITPSSTSSKVMIFVSNNCYIYSTTGSLTALRGREWIVRGSTQLTSQIYGVETWNAIPNNGLFQVPVLFSYLDSPATTSSTTYKVQGECIQSNSTFGAIGTLVLMEIGA